jgi:hypothetical protein
MRVSNWPELLNNYLNSKQNDVYQWGSLDCCLFVADWLLILTSIDYAEPFRGQYDSLESALALMGDWKDDSATDEHFGAPAKYLDFWFPQTTVFKVKRGDIVVNAEGSVGICNGPNSYFMSEKGLASVKTSSCIRGWSIG